MPMARKFRLFPAALVCALPLCAAAAFARDPPPPPGQANPANLEQAVKQVQHQTGGHILAADTVSRGKSNVYRIKVLTPQGQVQVVQMRSNGKPPPKPPPAKSDSDRGGH